jgi:hypothetical protein
MVTRFRWFGVSASRAFRLVVFLARAVFKIAAFSAM